MKKSKKIIKRNHIINLIGILLLLILFNCSFVSCKSTQDLEKMQSEDFQSEIENASIETNLTEEEIEAQNESELKGYLVAEEMKTVDVEDTVVFIERPVYIPYEQRDKSMEKGNETGYDAVAKALRIATVTPEQYKQGMFYYQYNENCVYEIYSQPYHLTDIILEKGEIVISPPLLSEDETAWELTAGVAKDPETGEDIQHLFLKPAYSNQNSTLIVITDRRVYHFTLRSYAKSYMAMVKFTYPSSRNQWAKKNSQYTSKVEDEYIHITNPELLSFDYTMKYPTHKKPEFLPQRVYDDGSFTYIQVDDIVLQKKLPVLFNERNEIVNYSVKKNVFVIPRLINQITLRLGKQKVVIEKKKKKETKTELVAVDEGKEVENDN